MNLKRKDFLKLGGLAAVSSMAVPTILTSCAGATNSCGVVCTPSGLDHEGRLQEYLTKNGLALPKAPNPGPFFTQIVITGNLMHVSGQGPNIDDAGNQVLGRVGDDLTLEEGRDAALHVGLTMLSVIKANFGDLNKICRIVKTLGMVNSAPDFYSSPAIINGFSQLMVEVFGEVNGKGARSSVGVASLPSNIAVEIEAVFELK